MTHGERARRWLLTAGVVLVGVGGSFAPWINRPPAALMLTAPDLAEFVKFLPEVRAGQLSLQRLFFLLPLFTAAVGLPLLASSGRLKYPLPVRLLMLAATVPLSLALLSPVWSPAVLTADEFRLQTIGASLCVLLAVLGLLGGRIPLRAAAFVLVPLSVPAAILPARQFYLAKAPIEAAYNSPVSLSWGAWACWLGLLLMLAGFGAGLRLPRRAAPREPRG